MSIDISVVANEILAENPNAVIMVICAYGEGAEEESPDYTEEEEKASDKFAEDNWFSEAFWDAIMPLPEGGFGGSPHQDAILMDNPGQN